MADVGPSASIDVYPSASTNGCSRDQISCNGDEKDTKEGGDANQSIGQTNGAEPVASSSNNQNENDAFIDEPSEEITIDDAIEKLGMGRFQLQVLSAAGLCFAADAMQVMQLSFLSEVLKVDWGLTDNEASLITSCLFAGAMLGTLVLGPYADAKGRRPTFFVASIMITAFGLTVSVARSYAVVLGLYFMVGFGVGGLTVPFDILAELLPAKSRGKNLLLIEYFWTIGTLMVVFAAKMTLGPEHGDNWRLFVALSSLPCFTSIILGYLFVPESPRWLASQGRCEEALDVLRKAAAVNGHDAQETFPLYMQLAEEEEEHCNFADLFRPRWLKTIMCLWGAWGLFAFGYYGTAMAITSIFAAESKDDVVDFDFGAIFVSTSAEFIGITLAVFLVERSGRIPLQIASYGFAGLSVFCLCVFASRGYSRNFLVAFGFLARIFEMSGSCVSWTSTAEILTTEVRTTGHSTANAVAKIGAFVAPFIVQGRIPLMQMGYVMLAVHAGTVILVSQLPETAGGQLGRGGGRSDTEGEHRHESVNGDHSDVSTVDDATMNGSLLATEEAFDNGSAPGEDSGIL